jgi:transketolase
VSVADDLTQLTTARVPDDWTELDTRAVDTIRVLAAEAVQRVGNGHPGTAMSLAPLAYTLFQRVLRHDPTDPAWTGRDRFVLSCGHSSLTLYLQLFLSGYGLELSDIEHVVAVSRSSLFVQFYKSVPFAEEESAVAYQ